MNILVTGGAGFIGSHACKALAAKGFMPIAYDNISRGNQWAVKWGPLEIGNIADPQRVRETLEKYRPAAVMHFAAYAYVGEFCSAAIALLPDNFAATAVLLRRYWISNAFRLFFHRVAPATGVPESVRSPKITRNVQSIHTDNPSCSSNGMLQDLHLAYNLPWIALRYFNAAGADPYLESGEGR